jgi:hypothetical protein
VGKQKFSWGRLDGWQPTDVINPRRFLDPFLTDELDSKVGVPAVSASYFVPSLVDLLPADTNFTFVWVPVPVSFRFPLPDQRWFPPSTSVPAQINVARFAPGLPPVSIMRESLITENRSPAEQLDEGAVAMRVAVPSSPVEWSLAYYDGPETAPAFDLSVFAFSPSARRKIRNGQTPGLEDLRNLTAETLLTPKAGRMRVYGGDCAFILGGVAVRAEAAYGTSRLLPRTTTALLAPGNLKRHIAPNIGPLLAQILKGRRTPVNVGSLSVVRDTVAWGIGLDYAYRGWFPLLQLNQIIVLNNETTLLIADVDSQLQLGLRRNFFGERLTGEVGAIYGVARGYTGGVARATVSITDNVRARMGYLLIAEVATPPSDSSTTSTSCSSSYATRSEAARDRIFRQPRCDAWPCPDDELVGAFVVSAGEERGW